MSSKKKKRACPFSSSTPTKEDDKIVLQRVGFEISRERQGLLLNNQEKCLKDDRASEKPIETTAESVAFFLRAKKNKPVPVTQASSPPTEES